MWHDFRALDAVKECENTRNILLSNGIEPVILHAQKKVLGSQYTAWLCSEQYLQSHIL